MSKISKMQVDTLKSFMATELKRLIGETRDEMDPELKLSYADVEGGVADTGEEATADTIVDIDNAMIGLHLERVNDLNAALDRIDNDVYGVCVDCGEDIGFDRLSAYSTAKRCIGCQRKYEKICAGASRHSL
jgi:DnaK suppressor protein